MDRIKIGGYVKQSLIDYPGKISAVVFTQGCNFRCGYCHNPQLVLPELFQPLISEEEVLKSIEDMSDWLDAVVISGGEPTIQYALPDFALKIKNMGFLVKLDTNGSNPEMLKLLLDENLVDFVAVDVKTILEEREYEKIIGKTNSDLIVKIRLSIELLRNSRIEYQLRTTVLTKIHTDQIIAMLQHEYANESYLLQEFRSGNSIETVNN
jgi:pyruvate formate lyase activating enzyme